MNRASGRAPRRMLIVDGYNVINARRDAPDERPGSLADAREKLLSDLMDYAGWSGPQIVLVFDAWMSDRQQRTEERHGAVTVVYTQKGEIADRYIELLCDELADDIDLRRLEVRVASSDALEQTIVLGCGATRMPARELVLEMRQLRRDGIRQTAGRPLSPRSPIGERLPEDTRRKLEEMKGGRGQGTGNREQATGNREQGTGDRHQGNPNTD